MTKLVTESTQEGSERGDLFAHRRLHPHADKNGVGMIVAKQFKGRSLFDPQGPTVFHLVKIRSRVEKLTRECENSWCLSNLYGYFNRRGNSA